MPATLTGTVKDSTGNAWKGQVSIRSLSTPRVENSVLFTGVNIYFVTDGDGLIPYDSVDTSNNITIAKGDYSVELGNGEVFEIGITAESGLVDISTVITSELTYPHQSQPRFVTHSQLEAELEALAIDMVGAANIEDFGADTANEDNSQALVDALESIQPGGRIFLPEGTFDISSTFTISKKARVFGPGKLRETATLSPMIRVTADGVELDRITLESVDNAAGWSSTTATIQSRAAVLVEGDKVSLNKVKVIGKTYGFLVRGDDCDISQCELENTWIHSGLNNYHIAFAVAISASSGSTLGGKIQGCIVNGFGNGLGTGATADGVMMQFNTVRNCLDNGLYLSSSIRATLIGNKIKNVVATGIKVRGSEGTITGNNIYGCRTGIAVTALAFAADADTTEGEYTRLLAGPDYEAYAADGGLDDFETWFDANWDDHFNGFGHTITSNVISTASIIGIAVDRVDDAGGVYYYLHDCVVEANTLLKCGDPANGLSTPVGIRVFGNGHSIIDNKLYNSLAADYGILVSGIGSVRPSLVDVSENKICMPNGVTGIGIFSCDNASVKTNRFEAIGTYAIILDDCASPKVIGNIAPGMTIRTSGATPCTNVHIVGNDCEFLNFQTLPTGNSVVSGNTATIFGDQRADGFVYRNNWNRTLYDEVVVGGQKHSFGLAAPSTGNWDRGDIVYNQNPSVGGFMGWQTTSSGSGTWWGVGLVGLDFAGTGSPEGAVSAVVGSIYRRLDGGAGTSIYVKESGTGNTGWAAK